MSSILKFICAISLLFAVTSSHALPPPPPTHVLGDLLVQPNGDMLLHHSHGVFRRSGSDRVWHHVLETKEINRLLAHQNVVYAPASDALYLSTDYGATWTKREAHGIDSIGDDGTLYGCAVQGEEASKDQGRTWQLLSRGDAVLYSPSLSCARRGEAKARHGEHEYVIDRGERLYYRSGRDESWIKRPTEKHFSANHILMGLHADRNGILYMNVATVDPRNANASFPDEIYLSRDRGERWEAISWDASPVKPVDLQILGIWDTTLLMTCKTPGRSGTRHICEASDSNPGLVIFGVEDPPSRLVLEPDGAIYSISYYEIERLGRGEKSWQKLDLEGVPDGFGQPRK